MNMIESNPFRSILELQRTAAQVRKDILLMIYEAQAGHPGGSSKRDGLKFPGTAAWKAGMDIDWMTTPELTESIPPAFTEWVGGALIRVSQDSDVLFAGSVGDFLNELGAPR